VYVPVQGSDVDKTVSRPRPRWPRPTLFMHHQMFLKSTILQYMAMYS